MIKAIAFAALILAALLLAAPLAWGAPRGQVYDVLDLPAVEGSRATRSHLFGITRAGDRLVAVGQRGFILYSDDWGESWQQASVPVRSTLLTAYFPTPQKGWATGHDGVVLHSSDGGQSWIKQLDGYQAAETSLTYYRAMLASEPDNETYRLLVDEMLFAVEQGADRPFFVTWFENDQVGWVLGAYAMILRTEDGGMSWQPDMEDEPNFNFRHIFAMEVIQAKRYLAGESGLIWSQETPRTDMRTIEPFYDGSFYTMTSSRDGDLLIAGLRGNAFRSTDHGKTWSIVELPTAASVVGSTRMQDGRIVLVTQAGQILISSDSGLNFTQMATGRLYPLSGVVEGRPGEVVVVGLGGVRVLKLD